MTFWLPDRHAELINPFRLVLHTIPHRLPSPSITSSMLGNFTKLLLYFRSCLLMMHQSASIRTQGIASSSVAFLSVSSFCQPKEILCRQFSWLCFRTYISYPFYRLTRHCTWFLPPITRKALIGLRTSPRVGCVWCFGPARQSQRENAHVTLLRILDSWGLSAVSTIGISMNVQSHALEKKIWYYYIMCLSAK